MHRAPFRRGCLHGLERIEEQIENYLLQVNRIGRDRWEGRFQISLRGGATTDEIGMHQPQHVADHLVKIDQAPRVLAFPDEMTNPLDDVARAPRIGTDIDEQLAKHLVILGAMFEKTPAGSGVARDRGQRLIQFVRERGG